MVLPTSLRSMRAPTEAKDGAVTFEGPHRGEGVVQHPDGVGLVIGGPRRAGRGSAEIEFQLDAKADASRKVKRGKEPGNGDRHARGVVHGSRAGIPGGDRPTYASASGGPVFDAFVQEKFIPRISRARRS